MHAFYPSLLAADVLHLNHEIENIIKAGANGVHLDIMDNHYVPNLSFGPDVCKAIHKHHPSLDIDVHLMTTPVDDLIEAFASNGAKRISIHPDACIHLDRSLRRIKALGCKAGLVLNPATSIDCLTWCHTLLDFVLIMTVNPGFGGQTLISEIIPKISNLKQRYPHVMIAVDGGVGLTNIPLLSQAGASDFIVGSSLFQSDDYTQTLASMRVAANV